MEKVEKRSGVRAASEYAVRMAKALREHTDAEHGITISELENACGFGKNDPDRRTLYTVLDGMADGGFPVRRDSKPGLGNRRYRLESRLFDTWEVAMLCGLLDDAEGLTDDERLRIREKLLQLIPEYDRPAPQRWEDTWRTMKNS